MNGSKYLSFLDTILLMAPFVSLMLLAMFRGDERVAAAHLREGRRHRFCEIGRDGRGVLSDPDGRCVKVSGFPPSQGRSGAESPVHTEPVARPCGEIRLGNSIMFIK
jgi:hypothetical protein